MEDLLRTILLEVRNLSYLFFGFGVIWVVLFGYLYSLSRRENDLQNEIDHLKADRSENDSQNGNERVKAGRSEERTKARD